MSSVLDTSRRKYYEEKTKNHKYDLHSSCYALSTVKTYQYNKKTVIILAHLISKSDDTICYAVVPQDNPKGYISIVKEKTLRLYNNALAVQLKKLKERETL